jgi:deoxyribonuclease-1
VLVSAPFRLTTNWYKLSDCAKKMAPAFRFMEGDLHNLEPAIGEINGLRFNYSMAMIEGEARQFGACDVEIADRKIEPRPEIRGDIARIYLYMDTSYPGRGIISTRTARCLKPGTRKTPWMPGSASGIAALQHSRGTTIPLCRNGVRTERPQLKSYPQFANPLLRLFDLFL